MPQDAFTIKFIAKELNATLSGGKISRVNQPSRDNLLFIIYTAKGTLKLEACLSAKYCRINLTDDEISAPKVAPSFCMLLRKHLQNAEILNVNQIEGERIIYMDLKRVSEFEISEMRFYFEIMGKYSNAVLTENGIICGALKTAAIGENTRRVLFPGVKYALPEPQNKIFAEDVCRLKELFSLPHGDTAKFIADNVQGIAYTTALEICRESGENVTAEAVNRYICGGEYSPCIVFNDGEPEDFKVRTTSKNKQLFPSVLQAQSAFYAYVCRKRKFEEQRGKLSSIVGAAVKKLEKRLSAINQKLLDCRGAEDIKLKGELITANIYAVKRGMEWFDAVNYYDENGEKIRINLDKSLSPSENAQKYYKKYAKLKRTLASVSVQKEETEQKLTYLNSINAHICAAETLLDLQDTETELKNLGLIAEVKTPKKKTEEKTPFRTFFADGFKIICGRNNVQNDRLLKSLDPDDMWLHTRAYHSSHVAVITEGRDTPDGVIKIAAEICAYYSEGRNGTKIAVDYTYRKFVKKPPKANTGFVIYTDYKTALADPSAHAELKTE